MNVVVLGGGVAGLAAVERALQLGHSCTWIHAGIGASSAASGALDWDVEVAGGAEPMRVATLEPSLEAFGERVLGWELPARGSWVVTAEGSVRWARGCDPAILDLGRLESGSVAVLDLPWRGWDAPRLSESLNRESAFQRFGLHAFALKLEPLALGFTAGEAKALSVASELERARLTMRRGRMAQAIADAASELAASTGKTLRAVLAGPWLFAEQSAVREVNEASCLRTLGLVVGETLSPPYGLAGRRFEAARSTFVAAHPALRWVQRRAEHLRWAGAHWELRFDIGSAPLQFERCVLALGGVAGGGIELDEQRRARLALRVEPEQALWSHGKPWLQAASETGLDVLGAGLENLERLGLRQRCGGPALSVAGDLIADAPRTILRAAQSGLSAME